MWTSFAKGDAPAPQAQWPQWSADQRQNIVLNDTLTVEDSTDLCGFWDTIGYLW
jgi:hypothetical protein